MKSVSPIFKKLKIISFYTLPIPIECKKFCFHTSRGEKKRMKITKLLYCFNFKSFEPYYLGSYVVRLVFKVLWIKNFNNYQINSKSSKYYISLKNDQMGLDFVLRMDFLKNIMLLDALLEIYLDFWFWP